jgi:anti-sigma factor RsiW
VTAPLGHDQIQELLGAYALDAVDRLERAEIEGHLEGCADCGEEVAAFREIASLLVDALPGPPASR